MHVVRVHDSYGTRYTYVVCSYHYHVSGATTVHTADRAYITAAITRVGSQFPYTCHYYDPMGLGKSLRASGLFPAL